MSGGSLDYAYGRVNDAAETIMARSRTPLHRAFAKHLFLVAKAMHDLEWVYSGDCSSPSEESAIRAVLHPSAELDSAIEDAKIAQTNLEQALKRASKKSNA